MTSNNYSFVSKIYSNLMKDVNYSDWAEYLISIYHHYGNNGNRCLEIAGGNGTLSLKIQKFFPNLILTDLSKSMLLKADMKNRVCCDMRMLPLKNRFDFVFSTFDSINYLLKTSDLVAHFNQINSLINDNGIYTFDVSLEPNSLNNIVNMNRSGFFENIYFEQISNYDTKKRLHHNKFIFYENDKIVFKEHHVQKVYPLKTYFEIINKTKMFVVECFDSFSYQDVNLHSERAQFIIKKK